MFRLPNPIIYNIDITSFFAEMFHSLFFKHFTNVKNKILIICHVFQHALSRFCSNHETIDEKYICIPKPQDLI